MGSKSPKWFSVCSESRLTALERRAEWTMLAIPRPHLLARVGETGTGHSPFSGLSQPASPGKEDHKSGRARSPRSRASEPRLHAESPRELSKNTGVLIPPADSHSLPAGAESCAEGLFQTVPGESNVPLTSRTSDPDEKPVILIYS